MPLSESSSEVRSCISFWAFWGSFQRLGSSASLFSSASRAVDSSTSKMPPQQPDRLLDLFNEAFDFGAHGVSDLRCMAANCKYCDGCSGVSPKAQSARAV